MAQEASKIRIAAVPPKPLLIYDGDCGFCKRWIERFKRWTADTIDYAPSQEVARRFPEVPAEDFRRSVQFIAPDGQVSSGAEAVFRALDGRHWLPLWLYQHLPGFAWGSELFYRFIARHRGHL